MRTFTIHVSDGSEGGTNHELDAEKVEVILIGGGDPYLQFKNQEDQVVGIFPFMNLIGMVG